ncbi:uncharacterized protein BO97DRAFT_177414 [Aspergillus homomorphus CBS 101889]|uniref:Uncharacterized protein n=1 Tax=Aspergillus homomorphus (strain CBS 101889) TaxID=1450537 RepID=A0A395I7L0_ASPHC|nr:hypothetical protein BO97DRAFT_177414 [Aspergillus homomorphus CBS 101889]RAL15916.1 hypothetical protein BO97DRAFT_177414 [Aspergillus homomorphus CBS 101889]
MQDILLERLLGKTHLLYDKRKVKNSELIDMDRLIQRCARGEHGDRTRGFFFFSERMHGTAREAQIASELVPSGYTAFLRWRHAYYDSGYSEDESEDHGLISCFALGDGTETPESR